MSKAKCTGLRFRAKGSSFFNKNSMSFEHRESLTLLKRSSCNCFECSEIVTQLEQGAGHDLIEFVYWRIFSGTDIKEMENMDTYTVKATWESEDNCGGYVSELDFIRIGDQYAR